MQLTLHSGPAHIRQRVRGRWRRSSGEQALTHCPAWRRSGSAAQPAEASHAATYEAALKGVREGDILTRLGSRPIGRMRDLEDVQNELIPGTSLPARLIRAGSPLFIGIRVPTADD